MAVSPLSRKTDFINKVKMSLECSHVSLFQTPGRRHLVVSDRQSPDFRMGPGGVFVLPQYVHFSLVEELR